MEEWMTFIQSIGFPAVVAFYLLHRVEARLQAIHDVLLDFIKSTSQIRQ
ncbi:hypothetical protein KZO01_14530 [Kurthia zopfii]|uniref:YvrJ protein family n=1 Tax=Kurthia zopfii TaxID=1650 RepID=A0A2U3AB41_9BACL|nr:YvrJ family protein [Kurthia zopfii]PWI21725.1 YvrJ family protein [Kurthia zopfii]TDR35787.1 YvrJ-like protein [Kurthia zopfii]STX09691.1 YvrJ protein family [Kurthia zopfii]VEI06921.1 YvrJ protein family [Kurthia zopfii]GEK31144.1 hypothetical protein KZO01_14530 [Kurthia zopfii]